MNTIQVFFLNEVYRLGIKKSYAFRRQPIQRQSANQGV
jgi:hypothetical protein